MTKCRKCKRTWYGLKMAHCASCCRHFSSVQWFDLHKLRKNGWKCGNPSDKYCRQDETGMWVSVRSRPVTLTGKNLRLEETIKAE